MTKRVMNRVTGRMGHYSDQIQSVKPSPIYFGFHPLFRVGWSGYPSGAGEITTPTDSGSSSR